MIDFHVSLKFASFVSSSHALHVVLMLLGFFKLLFNIVSVHT